MLLRTAAVALAALAASGLLLAPAAQASSRPVQVNGNQLKSALLPASAFGSGYQAGPSSGSGGTLFNLPAEDRISRMSCGTFEDLAGLGNFGQTAFASGYINNPNAFGGDYPNTVDNFIQSVDQFASAKAASSYYGQAYAKYAKCKDFTESVPGDPNPGGGSSETTVQSFSKTNVGKYQAFQVSQINDDSESTGIDIYLNTLVAVAGTDVFYITSIAFTNDPISTAVMHELISRVLKLR
jgi:hypothetical protein